ncbi:MAG: type II toxin-antitoxin system death-on-curing family toxin [Candidatus Omnitrophota bacterium]|jgi:death-on-curing family protein|nr:type II toxin-antitoxin system death-on-curing family toxin [Candidatus Omnitrophota bacterium]
MTQLITLAEVEHIIFSLAKEHLSFNEPIPDFNTRFPNVLESCLSTPLQTFGGKELYSSFADKTGMLFYLMVKNHPFQNGNKRVAMVTLMYVLYKNKKWLQVDTQVMYNFAMWVAESPPLAKEETIQYIGKFIDKYLVLVKN